MSDRNRCRYYVATPGRLLDFVQSESGMIELSRSYVRFPIWEYLLFPLSKNFEVFFDKGNKRYSQISQIFVFDRSDFVFDRSYFRDFWDFRSLIFRFRMRILIFWGFFEKSLRKSERRITRTPFWNLRFQKIWAILHENT